METSERFVEVLGHSLFVKIAGDGNRGNVLCLNGGPGCGHEYLLPMADLAEQGYRVIFYDQLGCGRSERPKDRSLFVMERYVEEVEALRRALGLGKVHIMGSSCGGQLGIGYALKYQRNIKSLVTAGALHNVPLVAREMERLKHRLPPEVQKVLKKYEERGEYSDPEYLKAVDVFYRRHLCRLSEWPPEVQYTVDHISHEVYDTMNGPNEFTIIGNIRYWDVTSRLDTLRIPMLVTTGRHDEVTPTVARDLHAHVKGSKLVIFEKSSHMPFWEERELFMNVVLRFLEST